RGWMGLLDDSVREERSLLRRDNFEQVGAAGPRVARLRAGAPGLKVLATSREPLHVYGEHELPVPPLTVPDFRALQADGEALVAVVASYPSVRLFVERAQSAKADFALTGGNALAGARVCTRLD